MTGTISTSPIVQYFDNSGNPAAGGTVEIFDAGTTTHAVTWQDRNQTIANANPLTLNTRGECTLWLEAGKLYDYLVKDILGAEIANPLNITGATSSLIALASWQITGYAPTFINDRTFSVIGDRTNEYHPGRRIRTINTGGLKYATIISSAFSSFTTVTVAFQNATDVLDAGLNTVDISTEPYTNPAIHQGNGSIINLTGYTGADVALGIGQSAIYDVSAITTLLLRIACGDKQDYEIRVRPTFIAGVAAGGVSTLQPNNANTGAGAVSIESLYGQQNIAVAVIVSNNVFPLDAGFTVNRLDISCCTSTNGKTVLSAFRNTSTANNYNGSNSMTWNDTTTPWSSLGTLNFANALTGRVSVRRVL